MTANFVIRAAGFAKFAAQLEKHAADYRRHDPERYERLMDDASTARRQARDLLANMPAYGPM